MITDIFGKKLSVDDRICYYDPGYTRIMIGYIQKFTPKTLIAQPGAAGNGQPKTGKAVIRHEFTNQRVIRL